MILNDKYYHTGTVLHHDALADALKGLTGNASYDTAQVELTHDDKRQYRGIRGDGVIDRYDKGDGPEYVTLGKVGPNLGLDKAHCSIFGLTITHGRPVALQLSRSAGDGVGCVVGWLWTIATISPASSAAA